MITFRYKRKNEIKSAFSYKIDGDKTYIKFLENGKEYTYFSNSIELQVSNNGNSDIYSNELIVYTYKKSCYRCGKDTNILTYITYQKKTKESLVYPWDKKRLFNEQSFSNSLAHMANEELEYYPICVLGTVPSLDELLFKKFPKNIQHCYSSVQKRYYYMNICNTCKSKQGEYYIYELVNKKIEKMENLEVAAIIKY